MDWPSVADAIDRDDLKRRAWLASWFVDSLSARPDILERLWSGSNGGDAVGWRWCEYNPNDRPTYPPCFLALYGAWIGRLPTAPTFVLRATCSYCGELGFFVTCVISQRDREARGVPVGRCAACRKTATVEAARRSRERRRAGSSG
jgi:hypothetical protein